MLQTHRKLGNLAPVTVSLSSSGSPGTHGYARPIKHALKQADTSELITGRVIDNSSIEDKHQILFLANFFFFFAKANVLWIPSNDKIQCSWEQMEAL